LPRTIRIRQDASVTTAEPAIAVARDQIVITADAPRKYAGFTRKQPPQGGRLPLLDGADKLVIKPMVDFINEFGFVLPKTCE
jgi:hypothetical protein